jgi:L-threonylcarbamoyladenylate synthase
VIRVTVDPLVPDAATMADLAEILRRGGIVAYPTDTLYGLAVDPRNGAAVGHLFDVKARDRSAAVALIASDLAQAQQAG